MHGHHRGVNAIEPTRAFGLHHPTAIIFFFCILHFPKKNHHGYRPRLFLFHFVPRAYIMYSCPCILPPLVFKHSRPYTPTHHTPHPFFCPKQVIEKPRKEGTRLDLLYILRDRKKKEFCIALTRIVVNKKGFWKKRLNVILDAHCYHWLVNNSSSSCGSCPGMVY